MLETNKLNVRRLHLGTKISISACKPSQFGSTEYDSIVESLGLFLSKAAIRSSVYAGTRSGFTIDISGGEWALVMK